LKSYICRFLSVLTLILIPTTQSLASWAVNGDAYVSGDRVILTDAITNEAGSAWIETKIDLSNDFDISFEINLGNNDGGADGISFALHNDPAGTSTFGDTSGGGEWVGMNGICPALGIEVDTYQNGSRGDLNADHLGINVYSSSGTTCSGLPDHNAAGPIQASTSSTNIEDGVDHDFRITWNVSTSTMQVYFDGNLRLTYNKDIINTIFGGVTDVYIGYTASTGGAYNQQSIVANNASVDADKSVTPGSFLTTQNPKLATYTVDIKNNGTVTAFGTQITDTLPTGVTYVPGSTSGATTVEPVIDTASVPGRHVLSWNLSATPVIPGGSRSISFNAIIPDTPGTFENDFTVSGDNFTQIDKTVRAAVLVGPSDLSVSTTHSGNFLTGTTGEYSVNVSNAGPDLAEGIFLTAALPAGITYISHIEPEWVVSGVTATDITFNYANSVASGGSTTPLTITVNVEAAASPSITNSVTVSSTSPDSTLSNNTATDTITVLTPDIDLEIQMSHSNTFSEGVAGNYEIVVSNLGTDTEPGPVVVSNTLPTGLIYGSFSGTGWTENIISSTEVNWTHSGPVNAGNSLPTLIITMVPNSNAVPTITNTVSVTASGTDTVLSNNTDSDVTTVMGADAGNKPLYLIPSQELNRTMDTNLEETRIRGDNRSETWTLSPLLAKDLKLASGSHPIYLNIERNRRTNTRYIIVTLTATTSSVTTTIGSSGLLPVNIATDGDAGITNILFNVIISSSVTIPAGSSIEMTVNNDSGARNRAIIIHSISGSVNSRVELNSETVIEIDSFNTYDATFSSGGSIPSSFLPGDTVYLRTTISDPFGSYDISDATIDIINPNGITVISDMQMNMEDDSGLAEKTYEYTFDTTGQLSGVWSARITALEGTENIVTDVETISFAVTQPMPDLTVLKSVMTISDPVNGSVNPKAIPGAVVSYSIIITNTGPVAVDNNTFIITDSLPSNTELYFDPVNGPVNFTTGTSSLTYSYSTPGSIQFFNGASNYTPSPDGFGYDGNVTSFTINPTGSFSAYSGTGTAPSCSAVFMVRIK